jgi:hypothetical protein
MTRMVFISFMLILPLGNRVSMAVGALTLKGFRKGHSKIATPSHLVRFEWIVKLHTYLALISIPMLWSPGALFLLGLVLGRLSVFPDILFWIVPFRFIIGAEKLLGGLQLDVENLPVENEALQQERDRIVGVWYNRAIPGWQSVP